MNEGTYAKQEPGRAANGTTAAVGRAPPPVGAAGDGHRKCRGPARRRRTDPGPEVVFPGRPGHGEPGRPELHGRACVKGTRRHAPTPPSGVSGRFVQRAWTVVEKERSTQTVYFRHSFRSARLFHSSVLGLNCTPRAGRWRRRASASATAAAPGSTVRTDTGASTGGPAAVRPNRPQAKASRTPLPKTGGRIRPRTAPWGRRPAPVALRSAACRCAPPPKSPFTGPTGDCWTAISPVPEGAPHRPGGGQAPLAPAQPPRRQKATRKEPGAAIRPQTAGTHPPTRNALHKSQGSTETRPPAPPPGHRVFSRFPTPKNAGHFRRRIHTVGLISSHTWRPAWSTTKFTWSDAICQARHEFPQRARQYR